MGYIICLTFFLGETPQKRRRTTSNGESDSEKMKEQTEGDNDQAKQDESDDETKEETIENSEEPSASCPSDYTCDENTDGKTGENPDESTDGKTAEKSDERNTTPNKKPAKSKTTLCAVREKPTALDHVIKHIDMIFNIIKKCS